VKETPHYNWNPYGVGNSDPRQPVCMKHDQREQLRSDIEAFLASGGQIKQLSISDHTPIKGFTEAKKRAVARMSL